MRALAGVALLSASTAAAAEPQTIDIHPRVPLVLVVATPTGQVANISKSEIIRIVSDLTKRHTDFFPGELDEIVVEECKGRLACLALKARRDYNRDAWMRSDGSPEPFSAFLEAARDGEPKAQYMLMVSNVAIADRPDRISMTIVDLHLALRTFHGAERRAGWEDDVEATIGEEAVLVPSIRAEVRDAQEAETFLATTFSRELQPKLEERGHWEPYGDVEIETNADAPSFRVDGDSIGTGTRHTKLAGVRPGTHAIEVEAPGFLPAEVEVTVTKGAVAPLRVELGIAPNNTVGIVRAITLWGGVAVAAAGAAVLIYGLASGGGAETSCFRGSDCEASRAFRTFGYDASAAGTLEPVNPPGVLVVPLGYSLAGAGATFALGTWLIGGEEDVPWIQWIAGVAVGALAYGLSVALDGSTPEAQ